jgi:general secretion pathway protein D
MAHVIKRLTFLVLLAITAAACATTAALKNAERAEFNQDYDVAVAEYTRALQRSPDNHSARQGLERVRARAAFAHYTRGRRLSASGQLDEALVELQLASELNPADGNIQGELESVRTQLRNRISLSREGKTPLETLISRSQNLPPPGNELPRNVQLPATLTFRDASTRDVYTALARFANVNIVFDPQFRDTPVTIDLRNSSLENALSALSSATRNFYRITAQRTITVIPDTPAKQREYEEEIVQTFYLSNADVKETMDLLRIVIDNRRLAPITATNALSIKDTPERVAAAGKLIAAIDKARPEVVIDVELLEVDRTRLREYGLQIASPGSPGIDGAIDANREGLTLRDLRNLTDSDIYLTNLPGLFYRLLKTDNHTRTLANPQLRTSEGVAAQARFGERVPVPVTTFSPIAQGGVNQQPITSFNYENIGVNIDITPRTHHDDEVSLALKVEVSAISGTGFGGLPTFGNRTISTVLRLRDGETNMLAGLIRDDERTVLEGIPGLSDLPVVGRLFAHNKKETQETDIVLTLTPRIIRVLELTEDDLRPFKVGRSGETPLIELPLVNEPATPPGPPLPPPAAAPPSQPPPPTQQGAPPADRPNQAQPITPPQQNTPGQPLPPRQQ